MKTGDPVLFIRGCINVITMLIFCFLPCNFGEDVTTHYADLADTTYGMSWHLVPLELQSSFKIMIMITQKPIQLDGFAGLKCTRDTYKEVAY